MPQIRGMFMHRGQNPPSKLGQDFPRSELFALNLGEGFPRSELFASNLGHVYARWGEIRPKSGAGFSEVGIICLEFGTRLCTGGRIFPRI